MPLGANTNIPLSIFSLQSVWLIVSIMLMTLAVLHFVYTLFVVRQIQLMTDTLRTEVSPVIRLLSVIYAGLALGVVVLFVGLLF